MSFPVDPFISFVVERAGDLLIEEVRFLCGVKDEVEKMQSELRWMQSFLEDADRLHAPAQSSVDRLTLSEIKEQSLDAEDVVDSYLVKLALRERGGTLNLIKRYARNVFETRDIRKVGLEIEAIKLRLETLKTRLKSRDPIFGEASSSSIGGQAQPGQRPRTYGHVLDRNIVGLDGKTEEVVGLLLREEEPCRVVSIYGMGGLGKSTLAKKVYHSHNIRSHFHKFEWVCVSQQFEPRDVLETTYIKLTSPSPEQRKEIKRLTDDEIVSKLYQVQKDHKCFIVLDDIWNIVAWNKLSAAFPMEETATGSKILLTTRNQKLAEHVDRRGSYSGLEPLSPDQSWELLQRIAFAGRDDIKDKESMEILGKKMIEHCGGLPLAITVLAGALATKETCREWEIVGNNIKAYLRRGKGDNDEQCLGVDGVLSFSYYDLPYQLKSCFLYLSQFPEDHEIETSRLLKMWMAEGFVSTQNDGYGEEMVEDVAERYLNELVGRCMIQVGRRGSSGRIKTCVMHDLMRDMCLLKAKEENFIQSCIRGVHINKSGGKVRRLSLFSDENSTVLDYQRTYQLRSLIYARMHVGYDNVMISVMKLTNLKLLRMLVLERVGISEFSKEIGNLIQLKYLSLRDSIVCVSSMKKLGCLETLDLRVDHDSMIVLNVNEIWKMKNLRHLYLPYYKFYNTDEIIDMKSSEKVQTLVNFPPPNVEVAQVVNFPNLTKLKITVFRSQQAVEFSELLGQKKVEFSRLSSLSLIPAHSAGSSPEKINLEGILMGCPNLYTLRIEGVLDHIPAEVNQLARKLTKLILRGSEIEDPKEIDTNLGKLPNLNILHLESGAFCGREYLCFQRGSFPQLKSLRFEGLYNLREWRVDEGAMPNLQYLKITRCYSLEMVPEGLRFLPLKELYIGTKRGRSVYKKERLQEGGADYEKVKHIPSINK